MSVIRIPRQRAVIHRREVAQAIANIVAADGATTGRTQILEVLRKALDNGRAEIARRLLAAPGAGHDSARAHTFLIDQIIRIIYDHIVSAVYPVGNRSTGEQLAILAVGGYGRGEMAPSSDIDIAFITPTRHNAWCEQVIEAMLYFLWDLSLKVGQSSRSLDDMVRLCKADLTIRTAMLEGRYVWGDQPVYHKAMLRFWREVVTGTEQQFVIEKLAEREARHKRLGDSRYVVEPNIKEGKGGLRDLHTLYWIGKYIYKVREPAELVRAGLFTQQEYRAFRRAENFFWAVRCHLHTITGHGEDRLTFNLQREVATRMNFADRTGRSAVERFMQFYFLQAKIVGSLSGIFLSQLDEQFSSTNDHAQPEARHRVHGYKVINGRLSAPSDEWFTKKPGRLVEIYAIANMRTMDIHPATRRQIARDAKRITAKIRRDKTANKRFLDILTSKHTPEITLRQMNEDGVLGRFIPDFGKVNAQMQFDMYHHFTVDEHTIRAIGLLSRIEKGELREDHPIASQIIHKVQSRRALYAAVLFHDIAKGRGGDHSILGAEIADQLCPRLGLDQSETDLVSWLVRNHLLMSATAFKRDLTDPKTITDFVEVVQSVDRLRQLAILTAVDIRAVGPGTWNSWKRQLLDELYFAAEERLRLGHAQYARAERVQAKKEQVAALLGENAGLIETTGELLSDAYWIAEAGDVIKTNLEQFAETQGQPFTISAEYYASRGATLVTIIAADHPGLFYRIAGGIHLAGGNIIDARIHTARNGMAVDNFLVQDPLGRPFQESHQLERLKLSIESALTDKAMLLSQLSKREPIRRNTEAFDVQPRINLDNQASSRFTVIEVNARDRAALLYQLGEALFKSKLIVHSAHITNYGERAADTFYVTDLQGKKVLSATRLKSIENKLLKAASDPNATQESVSA